MIIVMYITTDAGSTHQPQGGGGGETGNSNAKELPRSAGPTTTRMKSCRHEEHGGVELWYCHCHHDTPSLTGVSVMSPLSYELILCLNYI